MTRMTDAVSEWRRDAQAEQPNGLIEAMQAELNALAEELARIDAVSAATDLDQDVFVPAEHVEGLIDAIRSELDALAEELAAAEAAASAAELRLDVSEPAAADLDERAFEEVRAAVESMRAIAELEIALAVDHALARAAARIAEADAEAEWILAAARSGSEAGVSRRPAPPRQRRHRFSSFTSAHPASTPPSMPAQPRPAPEPRTAPQPRTAPVPLLEAPPAPPASAQKAVAVRISEGPTEEPEAGLRREGEGTPAHRLSPIPIDAVLPMLALLMLLGVVLVWMG